MEWLVRVLNRCLSFVAFVTAATLVVYMLVVIVTGTLDVANLMLDTVLLSPEARQSVFSALNTEFLHNIAILLILMKAYRILIEYMRYHHIDLKYMVEIAVIACVLELLFNSNSYTPQMQLILAGVGVSFLAIYAFRYTSLVQAVTDTQVAFSNRLNRNTKPGAEIPLKEDVPEISKSIKKIASARRRLK